jgi:hypothetical protein
VALEAVDRMPLFQRKKIVVDVSGPGKRGHIVAVGAVGRITALDMVWIRCPVVIGLVAVDAFNTFGLETQEGGGNVAVAAVCRDVCSKKRKPAALVQAGDVIDDP